MKNRNDEVIAAAEAACDRAEAAGLIRVAPRTTGGCYTAADFKRDATPPPTATAPGSTEAAVSNGGVTVHINLQGGKK